jgi:hypothetical protein
MFSRISFLAADEDIFCEKANSDGNNNDDDDSILEILFILGIFCSIDAYLE